MGGFGVFHFGLKYPETFGTFSCLAGALLNAESIRGGTGRREDQQRREVFKEVFGSDLEYFKANSPWTLIETDADKVRGKTVIRIVVGDEDQTRQRNIEFHETLDRLDIPHEFKLVPGIGHKHIGLYRLLGDKSWAFWSKAFGEADKGG